MLMSLFAVSDRKGLLRWRNSKRFWLVAGVQRPVMRDTLPSVKAEFWSGYDCFGGLSLDLQFMKLVRKVSPFVNWSPISLLGRTTGNG